MIFFVAGAINKFDVIADVIEVCDESTQIIDPNINFRKRNLIEGNILKNKILNFV